MCSLRYNLANIYTIFFNKQIHVLQKQEKSSNKFTLLLLLLFGDWVSWRRWIHKKDQCKVDKHGHYLHSIMLYYINIKPVFQPLTSSNFPTHGKNSIIDGKAIYFCRFAHCIEWNNVVIGNLQLQIVTSNCLYVNLLPQRLRLVP